MGAIVLTIACAVITSSAVFGFIQFMIARKDTKHDDLKNIKEQLKHQDREILRTQMLMLILMRPKEQQEILTIAERYFVTLKGDWYMTSIFNTWLNEMDIAEPEWFKK